MWRIPSDYSSNFQSIIPQFWQGNLLLWGGGRYRGINKFGVWDVANHWSSINWIRWMGISVKLVFDRFLKPILLYKPAPQMLTAKKGISFEKWASSGRFFFSDLLQVLQKIYDFQPDGPNRPEPARHVGVAAAAAAAKDLRLRIKIKIHFRTTFPPALNGYCSLPVSLPLPLSMLLMRLSLLLLLLLLLMLLARSLVWPSVNLRLHVVIPIRNLHLVRNWSNQDKTYLSGTPFELNTCGPNISWRR